MAQNPAESRDDRDDVVSRTYQVGDLLEMVRRKLGESEEDSHGIIERAIETGGFLSSEYQLDWSGDDLVILDSPATHARIDRQLEELRVSGFEPIAIEVQFVPVTRAMLDALELDWRLLGSDYWSEEDLDSASDRFGQDSPSASEGPVRGRVRTTVEDHLPAMIAVANTGELRQSLSSPRRLDEPQPSVFSGQWGGREDFDFTVIEPPVDDQLPTRVVFEGTRLRYRPRLRSGDHVQLDVVLRLSDLQGVRTVSPPKGADAKGPHVKAPRVAKFCVDATINLDLGQSLLIMRCEPDSPVDPAQEGFWRKSARKLGLAKSEGDHKTTSLAVLISVARPEPAR